MQALHYSEKLWPQPKRKQVSSRRASHPRDRSLQSESGEQFFARSQFLRLLPAGTQDAFGIQIQVLLSVVSKLQ